MLFIFGVILITVGLFGTTFAAADTPGNTDGGGSKAAEIIKEQMCKIMKLLQGLFGALICVVAGLAACVTAAMGAYKMACCAPPLAAVVLREAYRGFRSAHPRLPYASLLGTFLRNPQKEFQRWARKNNRTALR